MNKAALRKELMELPATERLELVEELWESIRPGDLPPLTDAQIEEFERRHEALVNDPDRGSTWGMAKARLLAKYK